MYSARDGFFEGTSLSWDLAIRNNLCESIQNARFQLFVPRWHELTRDQSSLPSTVSSSSSVIQHLQYLPLPLRLPLLLLLHRLNNSKHSQDLVLRPPLRSSRGVCLRSDGPTGCVEGLFGPVTGAGDKPTTTAAGARAASSFPCRRGRRRRRRRRRKKDPCRCPCRCRRRRR